jgi:hypothetical protein
MYSHRLLALLGVGCLAAGLLTACGHHASNVTTRSAGAGQTATGGATIVAAGTDYYGKLERMPDGTKEPVDVQLITLQAFSPKTHHLRTIGMMIAVAGHVVARRTGRRHGALLGAASGYALSQTRKTDIAVPAGTVLEVRFKSPVTV